jgi:hypothetical protein
MSIQELEVLLEQHAALFYHLHHREATERLKRQTLREELARVLGAMGKAHAGIQTRCTCNMLSALSVRSATLYHEIASSSAQLVDLMGQEELAEDSYEDALHQLEALMNVDVSTLEKRP